MSLNYEHQKELKLGNLAQAQDPGVKEQSQQFCLCLCGAVKLGVASVRVTASQTT